MAEASVSADTFTGTASERLLREPLRTFSPSIAGLARDLGALREQDRQDQRPDEPDRDEDEPVKGDYARGAVAMANAGPNTNGSQFFICHQDLSGKLPKNYTLFGQVTKGMDVVDQIVNAPRDSRDLPHEPVAMRSVTIAED